MGEKQISPLLVPPRKILENSPSAPPGNMLPTPMLPHWYDFPSYLPKNSNLPASKQ